MTIGCYLRAGGALYNLSVAGFAATAPLVGEPLAKDLFFHVFAYGSKTNCCRKDFHLISLLRRQLPLKGKPLRQQGQT